MVSKPCVCISVGDGGGHGFWAGETPRRVLEDTVAQESTCDLRRPRGGAWEATQTQHSTLQSPKDTARGHGDLVSQPIILIVN